MATQAQFEADRRNAAQSAFRIPKSAIKPGLLARVVPEQTEGWQELLTGLYESLRPQDELQRFLVDQIAHSILRLQRAAYYEQRWLVPSQSIWLPPDGESIRRAYAKADGGPLSAFEPVVRIADFFASSPDMALLRYENACNRQIKRNLELLTKLQSASWGRPEGLRDTYLVEMEGAAPSAPPSPSRPEGARRYASEPGPSGPGGEPHHPPYSPRIGGWGADTQLASFGNPIPVHSRLVMNPNWLRFAITPHLPPPECQPEGPTRNYPPAEPV